jgi:hypothetical protein
VVRLDLSSKLPDHVLCHLGLVEVQAALGGVGEDLPDQVVPVWGQPLADREHILGRYANREGFLRSRDEPARHGCCRREVMARRMERGPMRTGLTKG